MLWGFGVPGLGAAGLSLGWVIGVVIVSYGAARWIPWAFVRGTIAITAGLVGGLGVAFLGLAWIFDSESPDYHVDSEVMALTKARLREVGRELDSLPSFGRRIERSAVGGCGTDSGAVFQPGVGRDFPVARAVERETAATLAVALRERGWDVGSKEPGSRSQALRYRGDGWTASGYVSDGEDFEDFPDFPVSIFVTIDGAQPCIVDD